MFQIMAMATFQALPFSAYCRVPLPPLTKGIQQLTNDAIKHNCNLLSNNMCSQGATCFYPKEPSLGLIETKPGFTINNSCVGARIRQRLYTSYETHLIVIHQSRVKALVCNREHHRFFLPQIHYRSHLNLYRYRSS